MKLFLATSYYQPFIENFLQRNPDFHLLTYNGMLDKILSEFFADTGCAYYWLNKNGQSANISIINFEILQKQWAKENNLVLENEHWVEQVLLAQIRSFKPDVFYTESIHIHSKGFLSEASSVTKLMVAWVSYPFKELPTASCFDLILTSTMDYCKRFKELGIHSDYMLPAFDPRVAEKLGNIQKKYDFTFIGGISEVHVNRWEALNFLCRNTGLKIWGYGLPSLPKNPLKRMLAKDPYSQIRRHHMGEAWGLQMYKLLGESYITFNIHEALLKGDVGNMRMFEATGMGTMILNDKGKNLNSLFVPGKEIETYTDLNEALEKYRYYLSNRQKAVEIGEAAKKRTLKDYNYNNYSLQLIDILNKQL